MAAPECCGISEKESAGDSTVERTEVRKEQANQTPVLSMRQSTDKNEYIIQNNSV